ncbi:hypothetical protein ACFRAR_19925 [Kitasatospora sp. NPDC056651]|uniref:hypothetical protein n=1 Tax=Kitasatospora sp. NPDC056651 TaxID=3345892 RepID=UPI0036B892DB
MSPKLALPRTRKALAARALAVSVLAASAWLPATPQASAQTADLTCAGSATVNFSPGLTWFHKQQTDVTFSGTAAPCESSSRPGVTQGIFSGSGSGILGCLTGEFDATAVFIWSDNSYSEVSFSHASITPPEEGTPMIRAVGTITAGTFAGHLMSLDITLTLQHAALECYSTQGLTQVYGPIELDTTPQ